MVITMDQFKRGFERSNPMGQKQLLVALFSELTKVPDKDSIEPEFIVDYPFYKYIKLIADFDTDPVLKTEAIKIILYLKNNPRKIFGINQKLLDFETINKEELKDYLGLLTNYLFDQNTQNIKETNLANDLLQDLLSLVHNPRLNEKVKERALYLIGTSLRTGEVDRNIILNLIKALNLGNINLEKRVFEIISFCFRRKFLKLNDINSFSGLLSRTIMQDKYKLFLRESLKVARENFRKHIAEALILKEVLKARQEGKKVKLEKPERKNKRGINFEDPKNRKSIRR